MTEVAERAEKYVGRGVLRKEDPELISGQGRFIDDISFPGMLWVAVVRSPFAHAKINGVDTTRATGMPGVVAVYSGADLFVHPTAAEGFSLTIVEAMACGLPVITVGRGAVAEIVEGAAITVDAPTPDLLEDAIRRVLTNDALREELGGKALERSELYLSLIHISEPTRPY